MDYSVKGILTVLQDLQRIHFGRLSMYVDVIMDADKNPVVSCCLFDGSGEPHTISFYSFDADSARKGRLEDVLVLIKSIIDG